MTTSGVTAWSMTANDIVKRAMGPILDPGSDPEADELRDCLIHMTGLLKSWSGRGVSLYRESSSTIVTTPGTASVTLAAGIRAISSARLVVSATNERMLWPMNRRDYFSLPNKATAGSPTTYYLDRQRDAAVLYLWPVSASAASIKLDYDRLPDTVTSGSETVDIREEYLETLWTNLHVIIAPEVFHVDPSPLTLARAQTLEAQMFDAERPDSYRFETDFNYA